jgi:hypothetical protein
MAIPHRLSGEIGERKASVNVVDTEREIDNRGPMEADAIAVRAIARYNIERRKAGQVPLDLKGIECLRQILNDTIERHLRAKSSGAADAH